MHPKFQNIQLAVMSACIALCRIERLEIFDEFEEWHLIQVLAVDNVL